MLKLVKRMRDTNQSVQETLEAFRYAAEYPCQNAWEHVFYEAVLSNVAMMNYLRMGQMPMYL